MSQQRENEASSYPELVEISPYLQADYWNDHMFDLTAADNADNTPQLKRSMRYAAAGLIISYLYEKGASIAPGIQYSPGVTFDPNDHSPGTLLLMAKESLTRTNQQVEVPVVDSFTPIDTPRVPTPIGTYTIRKASSFTEIIQTPSLDTSLHYTNSFGGSIDYDSGLYFGVVMPTGRSKDTRHGLVTIPADDFWQYQRPNASKARILIGRAPTIDQPTDITIGQTAHFNARGATAFSRLSEPSEILSRVNGLGVIVERTNRRRKRVKLPATILSRLLPEGVLNYSD